MTNATRNRIVLWASQAVWTVAWGTFMWILWQVGEGKSFLRRLLLIAPIAIGFVCLQWTAYKLFRQVREAERRLLAEGVRLPDEDPVPIRLAQSRESLVASLIAIVLIVGVFIGYSAGWFSGFIRR